VQVLIYNIFFFIKALYCGIIYFFFFLYTLYYVLFVPYSFKALYCGVYVEYFSCTFHVLSCTFCTFLKKMLFKKVQKVQKGTFFKFVCTFFLLISQKNCYCREIGKKNIENTKGTNEFKKCTFLYLLYLFKEHFF
jgi:hypothetical protein